MEKQRSRLAAMLRMKCPYCRQGDLFVSHPYDLRRAGDMHENCPQCHGRFTIEPGFYYGAMYVSYALMVAFGVAFWVALQVLAPQLELLTTVLVIIGGLLLLTPLAYAWSKSIWAHMFLRYKGARGHIQKKS